MINVRDFVDARLYTVISNFAAIGQLETLHQLYDRLYISLEVYEEIRAGLEEGYRFYTDIDRCIHPLAAEGWIHLTGVTNEQEISLFGELLWNQSQRYDLIRLYRQPHLIINNLQRGFILL